MTDRQRRQRRLLAVRTLEVNLAAAELRGLRAQQESAHEALNLWRERAMLPLRTATPSSEQWLLSCAERQIAAVHAGALVQELADRAIIIQVKAVAEQQRRVAQEQIHKLCDALKKTEQHEEDRREQHRLDDLFNGGLHRRHPAKSTNPSFL